jgi:SAM-dependent methyltransferase
MAQWFETWFDSEYYHLLYSHRNYQEAERFIRNILDELSVQQGSTMLDAACGKGRHSILMNSLGCTVCGIDLSQNSIMEAKRHESESLKFEVADLRNFKLDRKFDYVFNLFTSFGYFSNQAENLNVLKQFREHLQPNGMLLIDYMNAIKVESNLIKEEVIIKQDIRFLIKREVRDGCIVKEIYVDAEGGLYFEEIVSAFRLEDFQKMFSSVGFRLIDTFGNYDFEAFDPNESPRLILLAQLS